MSQERMIPAEFIDLYGASTPHEAIEIAEGLLSHKTPQEQRRLLQDTFFVRAVQSALGGLDECKEQHISALQGSVDKENLQLAEEILL